jgi:hypothetical protein
MGLGPAGEVMTAVYTAMLAGLSYSSLADAAFAHLTMAEGLSSTMAEGLSSLFLNVPPRAERHAMSKVAYLMSSPRPLQDPDARFRGNSVHA